MVSQAPAASHTATVTSRVIGCAALAVAYLVTAQLARSIHLEHTLASFIWPPTGIALAMVLLLGPGLWPGIAVGTFVTVLLADLSPLAAVWITAADVAEALGALWILRNIGFHKALDRVRDVVALAVVAVVASLLSAGTSTAALLAFGDRDVESINRIFSDWWWGHVSADLVIAPLLLTWAARSRLQPPSARIRELAALIVAITVLVAILFADWLHEWLPGSPAPYYLIPLLMWAGLRFGPRAAATASFGVCIVAIVTTTLGRGPFTELAQLQSFVSVASLATLLLSAAVLEKIRAVQRGGAIQMAALDAIVSIDAHGRVIELNPAAERLFRYSAHELLGRDAADMLIPPERRAAFHEALGTYRRGATRLLAGRRYRTTALRGDGSEVAVEVAIASVDFDGDPVLTGFIRDRTVENLAEQARQHAQLLLEEKVRERTAELLAINHELERGEELMREAEELAHLGSFELVVESGRLEWSDELYRIFGRDRRSFTPTFETFLGAIHPDDRERARRAVEEVVKNDTPLAMEERIVRPDGAIRLVQSRIKAYRDSGSTSVRILGCCQDVTEQREAEEARYRLADIVESSEDAMIGLSVTGIIDCWNAAATRIFGYSREEMLGRPCTVLVPPQCATYVTRALAATVKGDHDPHYELVHRRKDGRLFDAAVTTSAIRDDEGQLIGLSKVLRDITQQRLIRNQLEQSLREKEVLLREIHHRVKNNLQVISSLLNLQVTAETSEHARRGLVESQSRIQSMALVHQLLYQSPELGEIDFTDYLRALAARLLQTYNIGAPRIDISVTGPALRLEIDHAIPCGLIVNELVANAIGHAFPGERVGHIDIELRPLGDQIELVVRDDGIGIPVEATLDTVSTFGLQIARTLIRQLRGSLHFERGPGTAVRIVFPRSSSGHNREHLLDLPS